MYRLYVSSKTTSQVNQYGGKGEFSGTTCNNMLMASGRGRGKVCNIIVPMMTLKCLCLSKIN